MTRSSTVIRGLPQPHTVGALMLGAALALVPLAGLAQDAQPAPIENASPAATTTAPAEGAAATGAAEGGAASPEAAAGATAPAETAPARSPEAEAAAGGQATGATPAAGQMRQAGGTLNNAEGAEIGSVIVSETASGVMHVIVELNEGALPSAQHAMHIHETGVCESPTFESAGGHLAADKQHGVHTAGGPHPGDLPNITMGPAGALHAEYFPSGVTMDQILDEDGSALIIHADVDDYASQPSGNAGDRIACAVIELSS